MAWVYLLERSEGLTLTQMGSSDTFFVYIFQEYAKLCIIKIDNYLYTQ